MRRILVLTLAVLLTSGYFPGPAAAVDTQGPACANIKTGSGTYQVRPGPGPSGEREWSVSALEVYLACPFKFFAQHLLRLDEEPEDEEVMDPRRQGQFMHQVFEAFFNRWQQDGHLSGYTR